MAGRQAVPVTMPKTISSPDTNAEDDVLSTGGDKMGIRLENGGLPVCGFGKRTFHRNVSTKRGRQSGWHVYPGWLCGEDGVPPERRYEEGSNVYLCCRDVPVGRLGMVMGVGI